MATRHNHPLWALSNSVPLFCGSLVLVQRARGSDNGLVKSENYVEQLVAARLLLILSSEK